jgi:hypothetical protein
MFFSPAANLFTPLHRVLYMVLNVKGPSETATPASKQMCIKYIHIYMRTYVHTHMNESKHDVYIYKYMHSFMPPYAQRASVCP